MPVVRRGETVQAAEADLDRIDVVAVFGVDLEDLDAPASATTAVDRLGNSNGLAADGQRALDFRHLLVHH